MPSSGLLAQPLAVLAGTGYDKPVWHCTVRAAPGDRLLSDWEWEQVAAGIMDRTGLAPMVMTWGAAPSHHSIDRADDAHGDI